MQHQEEYQDAIVGRPLKMTLGLVLVIMIAEIIGGILSNSLALLSDAGHMLTDALALGLSLFAVSLARRPATPTGPTAIIEPKLWPPWPTAPY